MSAVVLKMTPKSPQLEEGHTQISNELLEAITAHPFKQTTLRVLLALIRKTYGFNKKEDDLSASQLGALLGDMKRQHITTALNELAGMRVIHKRPGKYGSVVGINKDYSQWLDSPKSGQVNESRTSATTSPNLGQVNESGTTASPNLGQVASPNFGHTKDNLPKDNQQKESADADSCADQLALLGAEEGNAPPPAFQALLLADGSEHLPTAKEVAEWSAAFPLVNVVDTSRHMAVWLNANPGKRKTRRGINKFIVNWLGGAQKDAATPGRQNAAALSAGKGPRQHANFNSQDYRHGVDDDGRF
ncbi:replication protein [Achromobacter spanius]|uniref:replication protein n=1 Tax=Achromobacter spanius TaxID=217203 RepID=UPI003A8F7E16